MKNIIWDISKSEHLKKTRGASFEDLLNLGKFIGTRKNPTRDHQSILLFEYKKYIWIVPFVKDKQGNMFLKTLFPSRKYTKLYRG